MGKQSDLVTLSVSRECLNSAIIACDHSIARYQNYPELKDAIRRLRTFKRVGSQALKQQNVGNN